MFTQITVISVPKNAFEAELENINCHIFDAKLGLRILQRLFSLFLMV